MSVENVSDENGELVEATGYTASTPEDRPMWNGSIDISWNVPSYGHKKPNACGLAHTVKQCGFG